jgi:glycosyltransferase involved in cell wall biosynthesis
MKILLLCNKLPYPANDGSSIAIAKMIEGLVKANVQLTVLSLNTKKHHKNPDDIPVELRQKVRFVIVDVDTNPTIGNALTNFFERLPFHVSRFYQKGVEQKLEELLAETDFDIVQAEGLFMMPYKRTVWAKSKAKVVLRAHNIEHLIWQRTADEHPLAVTRSFLRMQVKKLKRYEDYCATKADAIVPISPADQPYFETLNPKTKTAVCGTDGFKNNDKIHPTRFFHLGAMDWLPNKLGVNWLLNEVWPKVVAVNPTLELHLAGRSMDEKLAKLKQTGVVVHGSVTDAAAFRANHGTMLVPLLSGSGLRIKIIEGLAEGLPIISTTIGAEGIAVTHNENIVLADTAEAFAEAILHLASTPGFGLQIGKNAATLAAKNYQNSTIINGLVQFYRQAWHNS